MKLAFGVPGSGMLAVGWPWWAVATARAEKETSGIPEAWQDGQVTIDVDLEAGERWTAVGSPVEAERCSARAGGRHLLDGIDPATNEVDPAP